jgi:hypothetical protein
MYAAARAFPADIEHVEVELAPGISTEVAVVAAVMKVWRTAGETVVE